MPSAPPRLVIIAALLAAAACSSSDFELGAEDASVPADSAVEAAVDAAANDTATPSDTRGDQGAPDLGPACPAPPSGNPPVNPDNLKCDQIVEEYFNSVRRAKRCGCKADCSAFADQDLCGCKVYVSPSADSYPSIAVLRKAIDDRGCSIPSCPLIPCKEPVGTDCTGVGDDKSCTTL